MTDLTQSDWAEQIQQDTNAVVLDVRTDYEIAEGMIPNAIHADIYRGQEFINDLESLDKSKHYYVYCKAGARSAQACQIMDQLGFVKTYNLMGGFSQWKGKKTTIK